MYIEKYVKLNFRLDCTSIDLVLYAEDWSNYISNEPDSGIDSKAYCTRKIIYKA